MLDRKRSCEFRDGSPGLVEVLGDRDRFPGFGLIDGFLGTGGLHLGSLQKQQNIYSLCKRKIQTGKNCCVLYNASEVFYFL
jgi:hypothetical protein